MSEPDASLPRLLLITDRAQAVCGLEESIEQALRSGCRLLQLREKDLPSDELLELANRLVAHAHAFDARILINGLADVAGRSAADGVHRPARGPAVEEIRAQLGQESLVGVSTHSMAEARRAEAQGADYLTLSPIFGSASKPGYGPALGLEILADVARAVDLPVFALAGVTPDRVERCLRAGAHGVAVMGGVMRSPTPGETVKAYLAEIESVTSNGV